MLDTVNKIKFVLLVMSAIQIGNMETFKYHSFPKYSDIHVWTNNVGPHQIALKEQFDQGLQCVPVIQPF